MKHLIPITNDLFDIAARLRSVDVNFRVYFDKVSGRYQVHNVAQKGNTLAFVVPFNGLDARTVNYARYTSVSNAKALLEKIEKDNDILQRVKQQEALNKSFNNLTENKYES